MAQTSKTKPLVPPQEQQPSKVLRFRRERDSALSLGGTKDRARNSTVVASILAPIDEVIGGRYC